MLGDPLRGRLVTGVRGIIRVLPVHDHRFSAAPDQTSRGDGAAHEQLADLPVTAVAHLLHGHVLDGRGAGAVQQHHGAIEELADRQGLRATLLEPAQVHQAGTNDLVRVNAGHTRHGDEHAFLAEYLHHQAHHDGARHGLTAAPGA